MSKTKRHTDDDMIAVVYTASSEIHGKGVFALRDIEAGEYIGTFAGPAAKRDGTHVLWVYENGEDAEPVGRIGKNLLRYLNHAQACNAEFDGFDLYATSRIKKDQELTIDYGGEP